VLDDRLLGRLHLVEAPHGPRQRRRLEQLGILSSLARDLLHYLDEGIEAFLGLGLRGLDHQRLGHDEREVDRRWVDAVVHESLGDVERSDPELLLQRAS
jgi:hypothetical protein